MNVFYWGYAMYMLNDVARNIPLGAHSLSSADKARVDGFLNADPAEVFGHYDSMDSVFAPNVGRNVVIVVVESLNSYIIGQEYSGAKVTPTLDSIIASEGTISALRVIPQVKGGRSSDGHLLINAGMLPLSEGAWSMYSPDVTLPTFIMKHEPASSYEVGAENGSLWNHTLYSRSLGYGKYEDKDFLPDLSVGKDAATFSRAVRVISGLRQPYVAEIKTMSTHDCNEEAALSSSPFRREDFPSEEAMNYASSVHYFDRELHRLLDNLPGDPIVIIASDHDTPVEGIEEDINPYHYVAFIAARTGVTRRIDRIVGQVDIFPTILDITGIRPPATAKRGTMEAWRGLGESMLNPALNSAVDPLGRVQGKPTEAQAARQHEAWAVSDLMLRHNWWAR